MIYTILAAFALLSCGREPLPDSPGEGTGELVIRIAAPMSSGTKAGTAADGDVMNNLHIWLVDPAENVVRYASWNGAADGDIVMDSRNSTAKAKFTNISRGSYTVYFIANKPTGLSVPLVGGKIDDAFKKYVLSGFENNAPDFRTDGGTDDGMPLSLVESISISAGSNSLSAELIRACGRIRVSVRNNTLDKNIFLQSVVLGEKNPNKGYLFPQDKHSVPLGITYGPFKGSFSYTTAGETVSDHIAPGNIKTIIDQYIYESGVNAVADMGLQFAGGVFENTKKNVVLGNVVSEDVYSAGTEFSEYNDTNAPKDSEGNTKPMIIRNKSANYFIKASGSSVVGYNRSNVNELLAGSDAKDYLWQINESSGNKYIRNLGTDKYLTVGRVGTNVTVEPSVNNLYITANDNSGSIAMLYWYAGYNMCSNGNVDGNSIVAEYCRDAPTEDRFFWYMTPVTITTISYQPFVDALKSFSKSLPNINYLNDFGVAVPLTQICRNEDVNIVINVFYNPEYALVYFDVEAWTGVDNETTFD